MQPLRPCYKETIRIAVNRPEQGQDRRQHSAFRRR
jgi:hypothetical protein